MKITYEKVKEKLLSEKETLIAELKSECEVDSNGDETDAIQAKIMLQLNKQLNVRAKNKIAQIDDALKKLENKTYGTCEDCEEQIGEKRLEFNPYFLTCVACEEDREREEELRQKNS